MTRKRFLDLVLGLAFFAMAVEFGWAVLEGWDGVPGAVIVVGGIGGILVVGETAWHVMRRLRHRDRELG